MIIVIVYINGGINWPGIIPAILGDKKKTRADTGVRNANIKNRREGFTFFIKNAPVDVNNNQKKKNRLR